MDKYWISKYSASGSWNGEAVKRDLSLAEAVEWIVKKWAKAESDGFDASLADDKMRLDLAHDDLADAFTYVVEVEHG